MTRRAAQEARSRIADLSEECVGTIHSLAYRSLGRPKVVDKKDVAAWNDERQDAALPASAVTSERGDLGGGWSDDDGEPGVPPGLALLQRVELARARMEEDQLDAAAATFAEDWAAFKRERDVVDFTDMIALAVERGTRPIGYGAILVDEAQDLSRLENALIEWWAQFSKTLVIVGDPFQVLYSFRGADEHAFDGEIHKVLDLSYRVPAAVHAVALDVIERCVTWDERTIYRPREGDGGEVRRAACSWKDGEIVAELVDRLVAEGHESVMVVASCAYMIAPTVAALRRHGVPYHNEGTPRWNPLTGSVREKARAVLAGLRQALGVDRAGVESLWTPEEARVLADVFLQARGVDAEEGVVLRGRRELLAACRDEATPEEIEDLVSSCVSHRALRALVDGSGESLDWLSDQLRAGEGGLAYAMKCVAESGWGETLDRVPRCTVGTVHSVKGAESDAVILFPDLSSAGFEQFSEPGWAGRDAIYRMFYVGATRARRTLVLGRAAKGSKWLKIQRGD